MANTAKITLNGTLLLTTKGICGIIGKTTSNEIIIFLEIFIKIINPEDRKPTWINQGKRFKSQYER